MNRDGSSFQRELFVVDDDRVHTEFRGAMPGTDC
jgi:hypothetical protein